MNAPSPFPDARLIFLKALDYPQYARPEFYMQEQIKSGWSKSVFLQILLYAHGYYETKLSIHVSKEQRKQEKAGRGVPDDIGFDLGAETNGDQKGNFTKKDLRELLYAIYHCYKIDVPRPSYDSYEIIGLCARMLYSFAVNTKSRSLKHRQPDISRNGIRKGCPNKANRITCSIIKKSLLTHLFWITPYSETRLENYYLPPATLRNSKSY